MLTAEGADDAEIIIRPAHDGGWRVEVPCEGGGVAVTIVCDQVQAVALARQLHPNAQIRVLPAGEAVGTLRDDLSRTKIKHLPTAPCVEASYRRVPKSKMPLISKIGASAMSITPRRIIRAYKRVSRSLMAP